MSDESASAVARGAARVLDSVLAMREELEKAKADEGPFGSSGSIDALGSSVLDDLALEAIPREELDKIVEAADHATSDSSQAAEVAKILVTVAKKLAVFLA
jgi:hypothetical protein